MYAIPKIGAGDAIQVTAGSVAFVMSPVANLRKKNV
jgi:hypothetical protein